MRRSPSAASHAKRRWKRGLGVESLEHRTLLAGDLAITEINYNPVAMSPEQGDALEFIEVQNIGDTDLSLNGITFDRGISFTFSDEILAPLEYGVIVHDLGEFTDWYADPNIRILGEFAAGGLNNNGERIRVLDAGGNELLDFDYGDSRLWPFTPDGHGATLELIDPFQTTDRLYSKSYSWRGSTEAGGSPGEAGQGPVGIVVNEVLTHTDAPLTPPDSIELMNVTAEPIDLSGWYLGDTPDDRLKYQIPVGTILGPGEFLLVDESDFNPTPNDPGPRDFRLDAARGDYVWLTESSDGVEVDRFINVVQFGAAPNSESFGRAPDGSGRLTPMSRLSLGCGNPYPRVGPVVISELQYNPPDPSDAALAIDPSLESEDLEFIEIHNPTGQRVDMTEWRIRGGVDFEFDAGTFLESQSTWIIIPFNPDNVDNASRLAAFRAHYGLTEAVTILGGYGGFLSNSEDRVQLQWPDEPPMDGPDIIPRLHQDEVIYDDLFPWDTSADGDGPSLHRRAPVFYGNDSDSWVAADATPGEVDFSGNVSGDYNNDGLVDAADIDILVTAARMPAAAVYMDLDGSFSVTQGDVTALLQTIVGARYGDANLDGVVDGSDFNIWNDNKFQSCNKSWAQGDWNGDGAVDGSDLNIWNINKFKSADPIPGALPMGAGLPRAAAAARAGTDLITDQTSLPDKSALPSAIEIAGVQDDEPVGNLTSVAFDIDGADAPDHRTRDQFFAALHRRSRNRHQRAPVVSQCRDESDMRSDTHTDDISMPWNERSRF